MLSENLERNYLVATDRKNLSLCAKILLVYGIGQILFIVFFRGLGGITIVTFISGSLYTISGILGIGASRNYSMYLVKAMQVTNCLLMALNCLILVASVVIVILDLANKPYCSHHNESCNTDEGIFAAILVVFIVTSVVSAASIALLCVCHQMAKLFKKDIEIYR